MPLDKERGFLIREEYSGIKEKMICDKHNLTQVGGTRTKVDGTDGVNNFSIKNASGISTQIHLTTQNHFIKGFDLDDKSTEFIKLFCGSKEIKNKNKDRFTIQEIDEEFVNSFRNFLEKNKEKIVDLIVRNGFGINIVVYNDIKNNVEYLITYDEILEKIKDCHWVFMKGGIHLKNSDGATYFHLQREGKRNPSNRYNVLWHVHKHLFTH